MKNYLIKIIQLTVFILAASCLPQEKTTQCGTGEAYNATQRRCVTTKASSSDSIAISSVTPTSSYAVSSANPSVTHSIIVSDPFALGYSIKWNLRQPNGSVLLVGTGLSYTFIHNAYSTGSYILEAQLLDSAGSKVLDTRAWTINVITETTPSITAITGSPFSTNTTSVATSISATLANPDALANVSYKWFVNGTVTTDTGTLSSGTSVSETFSFDPTSGASYHVGAGTYNVQLVLSDTSSGIQYDSYTWTISNNIPGFAIPSLGATTPGNALIVSILDETDLDPGSGGGLRANTGGIADGAAGTLPAVDLCVSVDDVTGVNNTAGTNVYVDFLMNGVAIPNAVNLAFPSNNTEVCLGANSGPTYSINIPPTIQVESRTITAVVYDSYAGATGQPIYNGGSEILRYNWTARVRQKNAAPIVTIVDSAELNKIVCTPGSSSPTSYEGCSIVQGEEFVVQIDVDDDADGDNIQDYDPELAADFQHFQVEFMVNGVAINGAHPTEITPTSVDCYHTFGDATPTPTSTPTRYECRVIINPYDINGPVNPSGMTYSLSAKVKDDASPYAAVASDYSNTVTWNITTVNYSSTYNLELYDFAFATGATDSYVTTQAAPGAALNVDTTIAAPGVPVENETLLFNVNVNDVERDSHLIKLFRCEDGAACLTPSLPLATKMVTSTDSTNPRKTVIAHQISQDAVKNAQYADVYYRVIVYGDNDNDGVYTDSSADSMDTFFLSIENYNPDPVLTGIAANSEVPTQNTIATPLIVYSGFPITIDPGTITDSSLSDGDEIKYQWMIAIDSDADGVTTDETYAAIPGATNKNLIWSPGSEIDILLQTGTIATVKLCVGDNGWDNANAQAKDPMNAGGTNCLNTATLDSGEWFIKSFSNMYIGSAIADNPSGNTSTGQVATWIDPSTKDPIVKYTAYVSVNKEIIIEKYVTTATTGVKGGSVEQTVEEISYIKFPSTNDPFYSSNDVTNLSITGDATNKALYLAYMAPVNSVDIVHIRRVDIRDGKTGYIHQATFGWNDSYDDLLDNFSPGPGLSEAVNGSGQLQITVTQTGDSQPSMSLTMNAATGGSATLSKASGHFCAGSCASTTVTATEIANAINTATTANGDGFQGFIASASGAVITLSGVYEDDWLSEDRGASAIGQIMVNKTAGRWQLPMIDIDLAGADKHKLSVFSGLLNSRLINSVPSKSALDLSVLPADELTNDIYESDPDADGTNTGNDNYLIATKNKTSGEISVYEFNSASALQESNTNLFNDTEVQEIKLKISQNATNLAAYVVGRNTNASSKALAYARVDHTAGNFNLAAGAQMLALELDNAFDLIENNNATYFDISPGSEPYQLFLAAVDSMNSTAYLATISGASPVIDCSYKSDQDLQYCMKLTSNGIAAATNDTVFSLPIALGDVLEDVTIGTVGSTASENTNDVVPVVFHISDSGAGGSSATDAIPVTGLLNVSAIDVSGTGLNDAAGAELNQAVKHNIPYVNN